MIYSAKDFGEHCTVEIVSYSREGYPSTRVYSDDIVEAMDLAEEFYKLNESIVEVCEMVDGRWKLSYIVEPYYGYLKTADDAEETDTLLWLEAPLEFVY